MNTTIFVNTNIFDDIVENFNVNIERNLGIFLNNNDRKIAIFHAPLPRHIDYNSLADTINQIYDSCDKIIILVAELHDVTVDFIEKFDKAKIVYMLNGHLNFELSHAVELHWLNWFETTANFYKNNLMLLNKLNLNLNKPKYFDVLLGQLRPHRGQIFNYINDHNLDSKVIMTYLISGISTSFQHRPHTEFLWEVDGVEIPDWSIRHTITKVKYYDQLISLSQIIPIEIYNQTAYSLVAETWGSDNRFTFNTEKIVKPILARRLFLVASNQYYLRNLRALGFKTFDTILDESYDLEPDMERRCHMICKQMEYLISQPQDKILEQIKPIVDHNHQLMIESDWHGNFIKELRSLVLEHVN